MKIGLIGCGRVARLHMCAYTHIPEASVMAVADVDANRAKAFAQMHGIQKVSASYQDLLEMKDIDYVDICTPTSTHAILACEAARLGHNILLEKPMARNTSDCDKIIEEVSKKRVKLCIVHNQLFIPAVEQAKSMVDSGELRPMYFRVSVKESSELIGAPHWIASPEEGGILWETGCHSAYLVLHFLKDISEVFAVGDKISHPVYDNFAAVVRAPNQSLGVMELSWLAKRHEVVFDLMSADGRRMEIRDYGPLSDISLKPRTSFVRGFFSDEKAILKKWTKMVMEGLRKRELLTCLHHFILISKYIESIKTDSDPPVKPEDGRRTIALLECIEESLDKRQPVKIKSYRK